MGEVVEFTGVTFADLPPDKVLQAAVGQLDSAIVIGVTKDGHQYIAASNGDIAKSVLEIELAKATLLRMVMSDD